MLQLQLYGGWISQAQLSSAEMVQQELGVHPEIQRLTFMTKDITTDQSALPEGVQRLYKLTTAGHKYDKGARRGTTRSPLVARIGTTVLHISYESGVMLEVVGEVFSDFLKVRRGKARW